MRKTIIIRGTVLGAVAGAVTTLVDSLFMLSRNMYVPLEYPFVLLGFNTVFWTCFGLVSGLILCGFMQRIKNVSEKIHTCWVFFFLMPFGILYGILGRVPIRDVEQFKKNINYVYDHHLSFVWIMLVCCTLIFFMKKNKGKKFFKPVFFTTEMITFGLLYYVCSTPDKIHRILSSFYSLVSPLRALTADHLKVMTYIIMVTCIAGIYCITLFKIRPLVNRHTSFSNYFRTVFMTLTLCIVLSTPYLTTPISTGSAQPAGQSVNQKRLNKKPIEHVILIVVDTLRADRLYWKNGSGTAKNINILAQHSLVFDHCIAPAPWTLPSHASLFSGYYSAEHMCIHQNARLSNRFLTLAEIFSENNYTTAAIIANFGWLNKRFNLHQGFDIYNCTANVGVQKTKAFHPILSLFSYLTNIYPKGITESRTADDINKEATAFISQYRQEPFFLFLNYMDVHTPFRAPRPFDRLFLDKPFPSLYRLQQYYLYTQDKHQKQNWDEFMLSQYDGEIAYWDHELGSFFSFLKEQGLYDSSLIIVTSDHGELFGENDFYLHHNCPMYEGLINIPLIIKFPFSKRVGRVSNIINLTDLYPTVLSICGLSIPEHISGRAFGDPGSSHVAELYSFFDYFGEHRTIYDGKYKFLEYTVAGGQDAKRKNELFNLLQDPLEKENLAQQRPDIVLNMKKKLLAWRDKHKKVETESADTKEELPKELIESLKALGYLQ